MDLLKRFVQQVDMERDSIVSFNWDVLIEIAAADGFALVNCDLTFIGERPRISPHRESLRASLAESLGVPQSVVSVKATTTEGLGFAGRAEGLAALAVVLLARGGGDG